MELLYRLAQLTLLAFFAFAAVSFACTPDEMVRGCRIHEGHCICGLGCRSDFKYPTREDCRQALKGKTRDVCSGNPCANRGTCTQITSYGMKFRCRCEGTGFYGPRCQYACPAPGNGGVKVFPYECIVI
ncbi:adhesive plaque matrix protein 2 [Halyomorpha halys]|uniref:adhesive plaque matrix protein 2 n=1 Tax=Halyomorpha halys TaxID=286706 RepID=UPI0006D4DF4A|nr:adhesive plaque matrix protein 2 [Halyomorpha halys]